MREQRRDGLGRGVRREAQPPVLVGAREVDQALLRPATCAPARDRAGERVANLGRTGQADQQARERLCLVGTERKAPRFCERIPATTGDRAQQLAQALVIREAQHGLVALERG